MSFCLKQSRNWEGGTEGGLEQYVRKTGGFLSLQGKTPAAAGRALSTWLPLACMPSPPAALLREDGQQRPMDIYSLITESF